MAGTPQHVTLTAGQVETVTFTGVRDREVEVLLVADPAPVYVRVDGQDPAAEGEGSFVVAGGVGAFVRLRVASAGDTQVRLVSEGTPKVAVSAL